ncbi:unnamed protein product [Cuscuta campestris]|uniref:Uncharacterized protein n=1 Tax=Cuscuta campestris TaxID=132261 RepID=A0A484LB38_9ASTE|nr:unnamed protein product [Cuscuta campestris]VFQ76032.1 unnamed protein product [Cuscuta campestris]
MVWDGFFIVIQLFYITVTFLLPPPRWEIPSLSFLFCFEDSCRLVLCRWALMLVGLHNSNQVMNSDDQGAILLSHEAYPCMNNW